MSAEDGKEKAKNNLLLKVKRLVVMTLVHVVVARNTKTVTVKTNKVTYGEENGRCEGVHTPVFI